MVAIIIPIYKSRDTLSAALDSLVSQTKKTFMVIPSIDGDGENYDDLFEEYEKRGLHIYPIYSKENCGPGIARQRGIDAAEMCKYLMFLDADDMLLPRAVEVLTHEIEVKNADIVAGTFLSEQSPGIAEIYVKGITGRLCQNKDFGYTLEGAGSTGPASMVKTRYRKECRY